uniref:Translation initiation factor eIF2B subunit delta n=1 Tax=Lepeophtheirus salmonis TaxID=72036 RepID=A0A0K2T391_LEPSM
MSSSNTLKKKKGNHKIYNRPDVLPSGMLDAYMDTETPETTTKSSLKPVSTKNKNKKKLEQRKMAEEEAAKEKEKVQPEEVVILDSWEDYDPDVEPEVHLPPPSKPTPAKEATQSNSSSTKSSAPQKVSTSNPKPSVDLEAKKAQEALQRLNETIFKMSSLFIEKNPAPNAANKVNTEILHENPTENMSKPTSNSNVPSKEAPKNEKTKEFKKEKKQLADNDPSSNKDQNKNKEDIKAEREAKKAAKAARRAASKGDAPQLVVQPEKKPPQVDEPANGAKKTNAELKAERRAKQEAQRAAKAAVALTAAPPIVKTPEAKPKANQNVTSDHVEKKIKKKPITAEIVPIKNSMRKVMLFSHLPIYERNCSFKNNLPLVNGEIHPVILQLGLQYSMGTISGSNSRCVSLMHALKRIISDYVTPPQKELSRDLDASLIPYISFLTNYRTLSVSMENALRYVRTKIRRIDPSISDEEAKNLLIEEIDDFIHVNIVLASKQISMTAREKIKDGDVILTYGHSSLVRSVFIYAAQNGVKFRVIVADSRPKFEGKEMVRHLVKSGIKCTYVLISAVPYIIREVSKVIVGACSILANGTVNSRVGTSQVALIAKACNVPVLVCCETYKFSERVQTDSFVFNELGDPNDLVPSNHPLKDWQNIPKLNLLNLCYDITPACLVDAIISEISVIPGTSVPVVLRLKNSEANIK